MLTSKEIASRIDHTLLKASATPADIEKLCSEAREYGFATVCVNPGFVLQSARLLAGSKVGLTTVVGFPLGANLTETKAWEAGKAVGQGATEIDMVMNIGQFLAGNHLLVEEDIRQVVNASGAAVVKVILETAYLTGNQVAEASRIAVAGGAQYVKTSTGFGPSGATIENIRIMRQVVGPDRGVKASGGISDLETALAMLGAGANRLGASAGVNIISGNTTSSQY